MEIGSIILNWVVVAFLLFANGFFVAAEFSMVKVRKTRIEQLTKEGNFNAKIALSALKDLDKFIAAVQLGITISSIGLGWVGEAAIARLIEPLFNYFLPEYKLVASHTIAVSIAFALITFMHVVIGELMPKSIALQYPEKMSLLVARPMQIITTLFSPFIWLLNGFGNTLLKLFRIQNQQGSHLAHSIEELDMLINASYNEGVLNETEKDMLHNVFKFSDLTAKQVMIPRTDMVCIEGDVTFDDINKITSENQYTRYPVFDEDIDHITGIIHVKDLYSLSLTNEEFKMEKILRPVLLVPETITMDNLVIEFKKRQSQMAIVIDEFGGTSGLITLEDVLEEIFGEVQDEFDEEEADIKEVCENTYIANAMMRLDELAEFFELEESEFEDEDVDTIGGLVVKALGRIAQIDDSVDISCLTFTVKEIDGARIVKLLIVKNPIQNTDEED